MNSDKKKGTCLQSEKNKTAHNLSSCFENVRSERPLVECITNYVTVNGCANLLLAAGASPVMADDIEGAVEFTRIADALVLNIGTLTPWVREAMKTSLAIAKERGIPGVLDPVGCGAAASHTRLSLELLESGVSIMRCNQSEAKALLGLNAAAHGVDAAMADQVSEANLGEACANVAELARRYGCVAAVTGAIDIAASPDGRVAVIRNGHPMMADITGSGCMLSALTGAFAAANPGHWFEAVVVMLAAYGAAGEIAQKNLLPGEGSGSFEMRLIDAFNLMNTKTLQEYADYEFI